MKFVPILEVVVVVIFITQVLVPYMFGGKPPYFWAFKQSFYKPTSVTPEPKLDDLRTKIAEAKTIKQKADEVVNEVAKEASDKLKDAQDISDKANKLKN